MAADPTWMTFPCHGTYVKNISPIKASPPPSPPISLPPAAVIPGYTFIQGYAALEVSPNRIYIGVPSWQPGQLQYPITAIAQLCSNNNSCYGFNSDGLVAQQVNSPQSLGPLTSYKGPNQGFYGKITCPSFDGYEFLSKSNIMGQNAAVLGVWASQSVNNRIVTGVANAILACSAARGVNACKVRGN